MVTPIVALLTLIVVSELHTTLAQLATGNPYRLLHHLGSEIHFVDDDRVTLGKG